MCSNPRVPSGINYTTDLQTNKFSSSLGQYSSCQLLHWQSCYIVRLLLRRNPRESNNLRQQLCLCSQQVSSQLQLLQLHYRSQFCKLCKFLQFHTESKRYSPLSSQRPNSWKLRQESNEELPESDQTTCSEQDCDFEKGQLIRTTT